MIYSIRVRASDGELIEEVEAVGVDPVAVAVDISHLKLIVLGYLLHLGEFNCLGLLVVLEEVLLHRLSVIQAQLQGIWHAARKPIVGNNAARLLELERMLDYKLLLVSVNGANGRRHIPLSPFFLYS